MSKFLKDWHSTSIKIHHLHHRHWNYLCVLPRLTRSTISPLSSPTACLYLFLDLPSGIHKLTIYQTIVPTSYTRSVHLRPLGISLYFFHFLSLVHVVSKYFNYFTTSEIWSFIVTPCLICRFFCFKWAMYSVFLSFIVSPT